jgi:hypothetical protein
MPSPRKHTRSTVEGMQHQPDPHRMAEKWAGNGHFDMTDEAFVDLLFAHIDTDGKEALFASPPILRRLRTIREKNPFLYRGIITSRARDRKIWFPDVEAAIDAVSIGHRKLPTPQSGTALLQKQFPAPFYFVERVLCQGLTLLAGKSKRGKTYFCLDMGMAISFGWDAFKKLKTKQSKVLFVSLEDGEILVQENLHKINPQLQELPHMDFIYEDFPRLGSGAIECLKEALDTYSLIFIDILGRILPDPSHTRKNISEYQIITDFLGPIHDLVRDSEKAIVITDHLRKAPSDDEFDEIAGSMAKVGVADHVMLFKRGADEKEASVRILGKRINHHKVVVTYVEQPCEKAGCPLETHGHLEFVGEGEAFEAKTEEMKILTVLREEERPLHTKEIVQMMGLPPTQYHRIRMRLSRMYAEGEIGRRKGNGQWTSLAGEYDDTPF